MARHWDTYAEIEALEPGEETTIHVHRAECSPYEWKLLVEDAQNHKWWEEAMIRWGNRDHVAYPRAREIATLHLCIGCDEFAGVETEGTTEDLVRSRCLDCGAITVCKLDPTDFASGDHWLDGNGGVATLHFSIAEALGE